MLNLLVAVFLQLCMTSGIALRYAPFAEVVPPEKMRLLVTIYTVSGLAHIVFMTVLFHFLSLSVVIQYIQVGGTIYAVLLSVANMLVIRGKFGKQLFVLGVVLTCQYLMLSIPAYLVSLFPELDVFGRLVLFLGTNGLLLLLTHWPMAKLLHMTVTPYLHLDTDSYRHTIFYIPIAYFFAIVTYVWGSDTVDWMIQLVSSLLSGGMMVLMCLSVAADNRRVLQHEAMRKQLEDQRLHYTELKVRVEDARRNRHDFKHHVAAIRHYMDADDKEGLRCYCDDLIGRFDGQSSIPYTGNMAADGVIYHYLQQARQENVDFSYAGTIRSQGIADVDLCVLLGNALDNALTACRTIPEGRSIQIISQSEKQLLSIIVRNTFDGGVKQSGEGLLSRKRENRVGVGLSSMRSICKRYGGSLDLKWDDHTFTVMMILPLKEEI